MRVLAPPNLAVTVIGMWVEAEQGWRHGVLHESAADLVQRLPLRLSTAPSGPILRTWAGTATLARRLLRLGWLIAFQIIQDMSTFPGLCTGSGAWLLPP